MRTKTIQICGTGSGVGKSIITAGLCRILLQEGIKVAPFKAQNMSLNSFVTSEGGEIGRAQALQAQACRLAPSVDMNPILLKPNSDIGSQVIVRGMPVGNMSVMQYKKYKPQAWAKVMESFAKLKDNFEAIVIEGAGSPAEVNLKSHDIVNIKMAEAAAAPVILVGDIDKGGVFAWLIGTLGLLTKKERKMVKGFIINKFRGDKRLLEPGIKFLEKKTGIKVLGVIPYFKDIRIAQEDSVVLEQADAADKPLTKDLLDIAVIKLPHISNFTDFDSLAQEPDVRLRYVSGKDGINSADVVIIPGTKNTVFDLAWLRKSEIAEQIVSCVNKKPLITIVGICGGYQILGRVIYDKAKVESGSNRVEGLGLLPIATIFKSDKILSLVRAKEISTGIDVFGYEIHHGRLSNASGHSPAFKIIERQGKKAKGFDGSISRNKRVWGTYIHGIFDQDIYRRSFLNQLRRKKGLPRFELRTDFNPDKEIDKLAKVIRENINLKLFLKILGHGL